MNDSEVKNDKTESKFDSTPKSAADNASSALSMQAWEMPASKASAASSSSRALEESISSQKNDPNAKSSIQGFKDLGDFEKPKNPDFSNPNKEQMNLGDFKNPKNPDFNSQKNPDFKNLGDFKQAPNPDFGAGGDKGQLPGSKYPGYDRILNPDKKHPDFNKSEKPKLGDPDFKFPDEPKINDPGYKLPDAPEINDPGFKLPKGPELNDPGFKLPNLPSKPEIPRLPDAIMPKPGSKYPQSFEPRKPEPDSESRIKFPSENIELKKTIDLKNLKPQEKHTNSNDDAKGSIQKLLQKGRSSNNIYLPTVDIIDDRK